ncbi:hypothetical protein VNO77_03229 [Canavalia gladiata]|uniref:Uncharacterized protein n=1 Tax=Canavalia gladiata TaxID=3824 RepID=A0AAN9MZB0_CANGL
MAVWRHHLNLDSIIRSTERNHQEVMHIDDLKFTKNEKTHQELGLLGYALGSTTSEENLRETLPRMREDSLQLWLPKIKK